LPDPLFKATPLESESSISIVVKLSIGHNEVHLFGLGSLPKLRLVQFSVLSFCTHLCNVPFSATEIDKCHVHKIRAMANGDGLLLERILWPHRHNLSQLSVLKGKTEALVEVLLITRA